MQQLEAMLRSSRLVTLTGSGGAGKTRLALQVGADHIDDFADGVWLVELAPLTDQRLVPQAVAKVLGLTEEPGVALAETLTRNLKAKELLLILDNCEHLVEGSARLAHALLAACANVRILSTSREALRVPGETAYRVRSLATPDPKAPARVEALTRYAAVQLFVDRAVAAQSAFQVNDRERACGRQHLPPPGRHTAGDRAGGSACAVDVGRRDEPAARPALPPVDGRLAHRAPAAADAARADRLELRPADRGRAGAAVPTGGLCRRLDARDRRNGMRRRAGGRLGGVDTPHVPRRQESDPHRGAQRRDPLPPARDRARVRPGSAARAGRGSGLA